MIESSPTLSLLVVQAKNTESAKDFYSLLGLNFTAEQHGAGPLHYSAMLSSLVFEIYPSRNDVPVTPLRIGFRDSELDAMLESLRGRGAKIISVPTDSPWGRRAVVEDPDGNRIELIAAM